MRGAALLEAVGLEFAYGGIVALAGVDMVVAEGEAVCVIGPNGAGKSTLVKVLAGILQPRAGQVTFAGERLDRRHPSQMSALGIGVVLEGRRLFAEQSVAVNLELGAYARRLRAPLMHTEIERIYDLFPALRQARHLPAGALSGGQQQMVAIGRALMGSPRILILDEPSMGLSPKVSSDVYGALGRLREDGLAILLVEQNAALAFQLVQRGYLLQEGRVAEEGPVERLSQGRLVQESYLGLRARSATAAPQPPISHRR